jgi:hypothetical protein
MRDQTLWKTKGQTARDSAENCIQSCSQLDECPPAKQGFADDRNLDGSVLSERRTCKCDSYMNLRDIFASASYAFSFVDKYRALILLVMLFACSSQSAALRRPADSSFEGAWLGQSINSQELTTRVRLFFFRSGEGLRGSYRCSFETTSCLNGNNNGSIDGGLDSPRFQVTLDDTSVCKFSGKLSPIHASGKYSCYLGGSLIDHGTWELNRTDVPYD